MVWFDCECGESLKKPSVAKHLLHKRCSSVTCVDCNTTFFGNEFEAHIKCISEAQKYMGSLYQADSKREGAKQDDWLTAVTKTLNEYQGPLKYLVDRLRQYDNIPRKKKAFENFVANSLNLRRDPATLAKLWALVESCASKGADNSSQTRMTPLEWKSFEQETIEILKRAGGSMTWKLLQANLAKRRKVCFPNEDYDRIRVEVLANIPDNFLSDSSNIVKM